MQNEKVVLKEDMTAIANSMKTGSNMTLLTDQSGIGGVVADFIVVPKEFWTSNPDLKDKIYKQGA